MLPHTQSFDQKVLVLFLSVGGRHLRLALFINSAARNIQILMKRTRSETMKFSHQDRVDKFS